MEIGRVIYEARASYKVQHAEVVYTATLRGHFHDETDTLFPKVGDYVEITLIDSQQALIEKVRERTNTLTRSHPHTGEPQVMVANVDYVWIVVGGEEDFNVRRIERYVALAVQAQAEPIILINKRDLINDLDTLLGEISANLPEVVVHNISALEAEGLFVLKTYLQADKTVVLLGTSGAGKSTIINALLGEVTQETQAVRELDSRGRHTTTTRQLFSVPGGGYIIDTPGMRELTLVDQAEMAEAAFFDVKQWAEECQFRNCDHQKSAGCALTAAVAAGTLDSSRLQAYIDFKTNQERLRRVRPSR